jgi:hypothetical protein
MLHRIHERAVDAAYHLLLVAAVTIVVGLTTTALSTPHGVQIALVILALAVGPLALIELARVVRGQSVVGVALRGDRV